MYWHIVKPHPRRAIPLSAGPFRNVDIGASLFAYVWRISGWHQIGACVLALIIVALSLAPLELQRRLINNIVNIWDIPTLFWLGGAYLGVYVALQLTKFAFNFYQGWIAESAVFHTRQSLFEVYLQHLKSTYNGRAEAQAGPEIGTAVQIVGGEVDSLGEFVGTGISQSFSNIAMLIGVSSYMLVIEPRIALFSLLFLAPQALLAPLIQRRLNRLMKTRVALLRSMADDVSSVDASDGTNCLVVLPRLFRNKIYFIFIKFAMKVVMNLLLILPTVTVLVWGGYLAIQGETDIGTIVAFIAGFDKLSGPMRELIAFYRTAAQANVRRDMIAQWI